LLHRCVHGVVRGEGPQGVPARIHGDLGRASTIPSVQIGTTGRTEPLAIVTTEEKTRHGQEPRFTDGWPEVDLVRALIERIDVRVIRLFVIGFDENYVLFADDVAARIVETAPARHNDVAFDFPMPVVAPGTGGREPSRDVQRTRRARVVILPDRVVRGHRTVDSNPAMLERANVKGQHSRENYPDGR
jgi:hypothetical protein